MIDPVLAALETELAGAMASMRRHLAIHLYGDGMPRCRVPYAGWCPESILDDWYAYDDESTPPDTACLCEGGVCRV